MTSITQNLPWFIKDVGVAVIGKECYTSLIENLNISDTHCIKYSLSKGLGLGIVVAGSVMKVPQVLLLIQSKSAEGLSLTSYTLETLSYAVTSVYSFRHRFPFSTYGENFFLTLQNLYIISLIIGYTPSLKYSSSAKPLFILGSLATVIALFILPANPMRLAMYSTLPLSLLSKIPQIYQNHALKSTGQLSTVAVLSQILGCLARLFTTSQEVNDPVILSGFVLALVLNLVLGAQMWMYWGKAAGKAKKVEEEGIELKGGYVKIENASSTAYESPVAPLPRPVPSQRVGTSPTRRVATPPAGGRKWERKVD